MNKEIEDYENYLMFERRMAKNTTSSYIRDLEHYATYLEEERKVYRVDDITKQDIEAYLEYLNKNNYTTTSLARKLTAIKNFHKFLLAVNGLPNDVAITLERPKLRKSLPNVLTVDEVDKLLNIFST